MKCRPELSIAVSVAANVGLAHFSFAVNSVLKTRRLQS